MKNENEAGSALTHIASIDDAMVRIDLVIGEITVKHAEIRSSN